MGTRRQATLAQLAVTLVPAVRSAEPTLEAAVRARVDAPVTELALFNERNPQREVLRAHFGPLSGPARLSTRIRLATSQRPVALARMEDGSVWKREVEVLVALAACVDG